MTAIDIEDIWIIDVPNTGYVGWPTLTRAADGELLAVYSGGRRRHVCPFGQVHVIRSRDNGKTWTWPHVLVDGPLDDRDAGILQTRKSTFIVNWFSSLTWEVLVMPDAASFGHLPFPEQEEWQRRQALLTDEIRQQELGAWSVRSTDGGATWSPKTDTVVGSPHGPCELDDGRLLYVGKKAARDFRRAVKGSAYEEELGAAESTDDGKSWKLISDIAPMPGHAAKNYHELHAVQAANGHVIAHIRNHDEPFHHETLQIESRDGGRSWSEPHSIGLWGYPAFLLRASDGRLITTVGHRREPQGNQIAISEDHGKTWSVQMPFNTDSAGDFGYPSTVEIAPNIFLSLWYDTQGSGAARLRLARWKLR